MSDGAENDAYLDLVEAEVARAVERRGVERAILELGAIKLALTTARVDARSTVRRTALTLGIDRIDVRIGDLRTELEGLS